MGTRQRKWEKKKLKTGKCRICGKKRPRKLKTLCAECNTKENARRKKARDKKKREDAERVKEAAERAVQAKLGKNTIHEITPPVSPLSSSVHRASPTPPLAQYIGPKVSDHVPSFPPMQPPSTDN